MDRRRLFIISKNDDVIKFANPEVGRICVENWGSNGKITKDQAAAVTTLGTVFRNNTKITSFDELKYFTGVNYIITEAFNNCNQLTSLCVENITNYIGDRALRSTALSGILTFPTQRIGGVFCSNNPNVVRINMPNITLLQGLNEVNGYNFGNCTSLEILDFGASLNILDDTNFGSGSNLLKTIIFRGNVPKNLNFNPLGISKTATYYVPDEYLDNWKAALTTLTFKPFSEAPEGLL